MKSPILAMDVQGESENPFPEPFKSILGNSEWRGLSDQFALSHFGVNMEVLYPKAQSALRHWHSKSEEFVYVIEGELNLVTDTGKILMTSGMCVGFKAGETNGHHLVNDSEKIAKFLVIGSRVEGDEVYYPDDDFQWKAQNGNLLPARKDGTFYK